MARVLEKNPKFIREPICAEQLDEQARKILRGYAVGRLLVPGDSRCVKLYCPEQSGHHNRLWAVPAPCDPDIERNKGQAGKWKEVSSKLKEKERRVPADIGSRRSAF